MASFRLVFEGKGEGSWKGTPQDLLEAGERLRGTLVDFVEGEVTALRDLGAAEDRGNGLEGLLELRGRIGQMDVVPEWQEGWVLRVSVAGESPDPDWMGGRWMRVLPEVLPAGGWRPTGFQVVGFQGKERQNPSYSFSEPNQRRGDWMRWLWVLPLGLSVAILVLLLGWVQDLKSQYNDLTHTVDRQKEQILVAIEEGLERGMDAAKVYDAIKGWMFAEDSTEVKGVDRPSGN